MRLSESKLNKLIEGEEDFFAEPTADEIELEKLETLPAEQIIDKWLESKEQYSEKGSDLLFSMFKSMDESFMSMKDVFDQNPELFDHIVGWIEVQISQRPEWKDNLIFDIIQSSK